MSEDMMRVGVVVEPGKFALEQRPVVSEVPEGWVLIDICAVGICGTDYHIFEGKHPPFLAYPRVIGHELSGRVVHQGNGWSEGELVVVNPPTWRVALAGLANVASRTVVTTFRCWVFIGTVD